MSIDAVSGVSAGSRRKRRSPRTPEIVTDPIRSATLAGLMYISEVVPGIRREGEGKSFTYRDANGNEITAPEELARIRSLAIPPAWTDVWICPVANGYLQATGRDAKGRKQYRYHGLWRAVRDETKFDRMISFGKALPRIRERINRDLSKPGLPRQKVLAAVVRLLETTLIRVGNEEYARKNDSYGLTTLRDEHVDVNGSRLQFRFRGKSGKFHAIGLQDRRLANIVRRCQELPSQELFQYIDNEGNPQAVTSSDVNQYLREISGEDFTAKDFRTWAGTVLAAKALSKFETSESKAQSKRNVKQAVEAVAHRLGNTPTICRKCYVHPAVLDSYSDGTLTGFLKKRIEADASQTDESLPAEESAVLELLQERPAVDKNGM